MYRVVECFPEFTLNDSDDPAWLFGCTAVVRTVTFISSAVLLWWWTIFLEDLPGLIRTAS